jgi:hypothetical protein
MATTVKLVTKGAKGKTITKEINSWSLDQFKAANQITTETAIEITEKMFSEKTPVYFHDGNVLIKTTFRASKGSKLVTAAGNETQVVDERQEGTILEDTGESITFTSVDSKGKRTTKTMPVSHE